MSPHGSEKTVEEHLLATAPEPIVTWAAAGMGIAAAILAGTAFQLLMFDLYGWKLRYLPYALLAGADAFLFITVKVYRKRAWAPVAAAVVAVPMVVLTGWWALTALANGLISYFALVSPFASLVGIGVAAVSFGPCRRAAEARTALRAQGLDVDF